MAKFTKKSKKSTVQPEAANTRATAPEPVRIHSSGAPHAAAQSTRPDPVKTQPVVPGPVVKPQPAAPALPVTQPVRTNPIGQLGGTAPARPQPASPAPPSPQPARAEPARGPAPGRGRVSFELVRPGAKQVFVAGSFNGWKPERTPLLHTGEGRWVGDLAVGAGRYEYLFVVDGQWVPDPKAKESIENPFGGKNSVLVASE